MAEKRCISKSISISEKVNLQLTSNFARLLYTWLIPHLDDFGRITGSAAKIKALVVPMLPETVAEVSAALQEMHDEKLIIWYEIEGSKYIQFVNFEEHQSGLHKRTKSKIPEYIPGSSGKFLNIPLEGKGTELNRTEQELEQEGKGTEMPTPDSNPHKDRILALINECKIEKVTLHELELFNSYIGVCDIEVIESCIKRGQGKHVNWALHALEGHVKEGILRKEQLRKPVIPGQAKQSQRLSPSGKPHIAIVKNDTTTAISEEELAAAREMAKRLDRKFNQQSPSTHKEAIP